MRMKQLMCKSHNMFQYVMQLYIVWGEGFSSVLFIFLAFKPTISQSAPGTLAQQAYHQHEAHHTLCNFVAATSKDFSYHCYNEIHEKQQQHSMVIDIYGMVGLTWKVSKTISGMIILHCIVWLFCFPTYTHTLTHSLTHSLTFFIGWSWVLLL